MAAYNTGEGNIDRAISRAGVADFWSIYPYISQQTRNYVPNILATILIAKNPEKYGFHAIRRDSPLAYDVVQVPTATSLQLIAGACDTSFDYLRYLNPELRRDVTPRGEAYNVRVPAGKARQFVAILKRIPGDRRETARIVAASPGEDLQQVALRTGMSVDQLKALNGNVTDLKATGGKLVVETGYFPTSYRRQRAGSQAAVTPGVTTVKARAGDTIGKIAAAHNVSADDLAKINGVAINAELKAGQDIRMPAQAATQAPVRHRRRR
jgi:membrane-bound lytic murein transglycosylase D